MTLIICLTELQELIQRLFQTIIQFLFQIQLVKDMLLQIRLMVSQRDIGTFTDIQRYLIQYEIGEVSLPVPDDFVSPYIVYTKAAA